MKNATLSIALLTLTLVLTSFTTPETTTNSQIISADLSASQAGGISRKEDVQIDKATIAQIEEEAPIDGRGSQSGGVVRKED